MRVNDRYCNHKHIKFFAEGRLYPEIAYRGSWGDWAGPGGVPVIPASQRIPEVILDTTTMGHEAVVVKNGLRLCGTGAARGSAPILQDKAYWEVSK